MAIAFDAFSNGGSTTVSSTLSWSHTCSGTDRGLVVISNYGAGTLPSSVTYNGVAMTQINTNTSRTAFYFLANPASGSNTVAINYFSSGVAIQGIAASYTGVSQTGNPEANALATNGGGSLASSVTTLKNNSWVIGVALSEDSGVSAGSGTTLRGTGTTAGGKTLYAFDSGSAVTPAGSKTLNMTTTGGGFQNVFFVGSFKLPATDYPLTIASGSFSFTGNVIGLFKTVVYTLFLSQASFSYTGHALSFILRQYTRVTNLAKHTSTVTNRTKNTVASVTNRIKHISNVTNRPKS